MNPKPKKKRKTDAFTSSFRIPKQKRKQLAEDIIVRKSSKTPVSGPSQSYFESSSNFDCNYLHPNHLSLRHSSHTLKDNHLPDASLHSYQTNPEMIYTGIIGAPSSQPFNYYSQPKYLSKLDTFSPDYTSSYPPMYSPCSNYSYYTEYNDSSNFQY